jgi:hypothetical protein
MMTTENTNTAVIAATHTGTNPVPAEPQAAEPKAANKVPEPKKSKKGTASKAAKKAARTKAKAAPEQVKKTAMPAATRAGSKAELVLGLLRAKNGTTLAEIMTATGWQRHSVRGFLSGTIVKKMGRTIDTGKNDAGERTYKLAK